MSDFLERVKRGRLLAAVIGIFLSGVMVSLGSTILYYHNVLSNVNRTWSRLLSQQQDINREKLDRLVEATDANTDSIGKLLKIAQTTLKDAKGSTTAAEAAIDKAMEAAKDARQAAILAKGAATTASGAAANAARANIGKREFPTNDPPTNQRRPKGKSQE